MVFTLDASTLIFATFVLGNLTALAVAIAGPELGIDLRGGADKRSTGLLFWALGVAAVSTAFAVLGLQDALVGAGRSTAMSAGNLSLLAGMLLMNVGVARFRDVRAGTWMLAAVLAVAYVAVVGVGFDAADYPTRATIVGVALLAGSLNLIRLLATGWTRAPRLYSIFIAAVVVPIVTAAVRGYGYLVDAASATYLDPSMSNGAVHLSILVSLVLGSTTLLALYALRQWRRSREASRELEHQARTDGLTDVANRRAFMALFHDEVERAQRYRRPLALVAFDLDRFKRINDTFGHMMGDRVLRAVARDVESGLRRTDAVARMGGEEFSVLLPETTAFEARGMAERLRRLVESRSDRERRPPLELSASFGVAAFDPTADDRPNDDLDAGDIADRLQRQADDALYKAKASGRNQVRVYAAVPEGDA